MQFNGVLLIKILNYAKIRMKLSCRSAECTRSIYFENTVSTVEIQDIAIKIFVILTNGWIACFCTNSNCGTIISTDAFTLLIPTVCSFLQTLEKQYFEGEGWTTITLDAYQKLKFWHVLKNFISKRKQVRNGIAVDFRYHSIADVAYRLGMNGGVRILLTKRDVLSVSNRSIVERDGKSYVEVQDGSKTKMQVLPSALKTMTM